MLDFRAWYSEAYMRVICMTASEPVKGAVVAWVRKKPWGWMYRSSAGEGRETSQSLSLMSIGLLASNDVILQIVN